MVVILTPIVLMVVGIPGAVHEQKLTVYRTLVSEDLAPGLEAQKNSRRTELASGHLYVGCFCRNGGK